jgi:hypothetical protein
MSTPTPELLMSAARLLRVSAAAFDEDGEPQDAELDDILEVVRMAKERVEKWLDGIGGDQRNEEHVYDALDVLTLVESTLAAGLNPANGRSICPLRGAMKIAAERLEWFFEAEQLEPDEPDSGEDQEGAEIAEAA